MPTDYGDPDPFSELLVSSERERVELSVCASKEAVVPDRSATQEEELGCFVQTDANSNEEDPEHVHNIFQTMQSDTSSTAEDAYHAEQADYDAETDYASDATGCSLTNPACLLISDDEDTDIGEGAQSQPSVPIDENCENPSHDVGQDVPVFCGCLPGPRLCDEHFAKLTSSNHHLFEEEEDGCFHESSRMQASS